MVRRRKKTKKGAKMEVGEVIPLTPQRRQHDKIEKAKSSAAMPLGDVTPDRVRTQNMLDRYLVAEVIDDEQFDAGMRLYGEWRGSGCEPKLIGSYGHRFEGPADMSTRQAVLRRLVTAALSSPQVGDVMAHILIHVCLTNGSAKDWALLRGFPDHVARTYGIWLLKDALRALHRHYQGRSRHRRSRRLPEDYDGQR